MSAVVPFIVNPLGATAALLTKEGSKAVGKVVGGDLGQDIAGIGEVTSVAVDPTGAGAKAGHDYFIKKPREERKAQEAFAAEQARQQQAFQRETSRREAQSAAEKKAGEDLISARKRQERRRKSAGRESTIAGGGIGAKGTGGTLGSATDKEGRKSLLGL